jgi:hypothetical protein
MINGDRDYERNPMTWCARNKKVMSTDWRYDLVKFCKAIKKVGVFPSLQKRLEMSITYLANSIA